MGKFNLKSFMAWKDDLKIRQDSLGAFAAITKGVMQGQGKTAVWADGRYLILHFDLMSIGAVGDVKREDLYTIISGGVENYNGTRLGGSVYMLPLPPNVSSERYAAIFWNILAKGLAGQLLPGDSFYLHYSPDTKNLVGGIAEVVPEEAHSLTDLVVPEA